MENLSTNTEATSQVSFVNASMETPKDIVHPVVLVEVDPMEDVFEADIPGNRSVNQSDIIPFNDSTVPSLIILSVYTDITTEQITSETGMTGIDLSGSI